MANNDPWIDNWTHLDNGRPAPRTTNYVELTPDPGETGFDKFRRDQLEAEAARALDQIDPRSRNLPRGHYIQRTAPDTWTLFVPTGTKYRGRDQEYARIEGTSQKEVLDIFYKVEPETEQEFDPAQLESITPEQAGEMILQVTDAVRDGRVKWKR